MSHRVYQVAARPSQLRAIRFPEGSPSHLPSREEEC